MSHLWQLTIETRLWVSPNVTQAELSRRLDMRPIPHCGGGFGQLQGGMGPAGEVECAPWCNCMHFLAPPFFGNDASVSARHTQKRGERRSPKGGNKISISCNPVSIAVAANIKSGVENDRRLVSTGTLI